MKKCFTKAFVILLVVALLSIHVNASDSSDLLVSDVFAETSATSYLLMDGTTESVLAGRNADRVLPMASTTKIMTCIVALEYGCLSDEVCIPQEAVGVEGSSVYLTRGEKLTLEELLFALMLESANDAATAIALHISDDLSSFADLMNQKAKELNMNGTCYVNPHGLPAEGHFSTARDLCKLLAFAMQNDAFRIFSGTQKITISGPNSTKRYLSNHNKLLRLYDACIGGKTGYTKEAGRCLVSAAEKNGRLLICATLGDPNDWLDHINLFNHGFSLLKEKEIVSTGGLIVSIPVVGGEEGTVVVSNPNSFTYWLREDENIDIIIETPSFLYADISENDVCGYAVCFLGEKEIKRIELVAQGCVFKRSDTLSLWQKILQKFRLWID